MSDSKRIHFVIDAAGGTLGYRANIPAGELRRRGHVATVSRSLPPDVSTSADVVVFFGQYSPRALTVIEDLNDRGKLTVFDIDDDVWNLPPSNPAFERFRDASVLRRLEACITAVGVVTTSSPVLAGFLRAMNPNVRVLPNMLHGEDWPLREQDGKASPLVLGWGGSASHIPDLRLIAGVVEQVVASVPDTEFRSHGLQVTPFTPSEHVRVLPGVPFEQYPALVRTFDVGLAPLEDTRFNRAKTDLKVLEYAAAGACIVASKVGPYEQAVRHGETGLLVGPSAKDWLKALRRVTGDADLRESLTASARRWAESRFIERDENIGRWEQAYGLA